MPLNLATVNAKLAWARQHFKLADSEMDAWINSDPHRLLYERNQEFTKHWFRLKIKEGRTPDFVRWSLMVGDCITNLRDTLDHLIYAIAALPTSPNPGKRDKAAFIIRTDPENFAKGRRSRLCSVPDPVANAVLDFQPFNRPHPKLPPVLGLLSELANGNKHKLLNVVLTSPAVIDVQFDSKSVVRQEDALFQIYRGNIEDGTVICTFELPTPDPTISLNPKSKFGFHIAIKHTGMKGNASFDADRTPYRILLESMFDEVQVVIDRISRLV